MSRKLLRMLIAATVVGSFSLGAVSVAQAQFNGDEGNTNGQGLINGLINGIFNREGNTPSFVGLTSNNKLVLFDKSRRFKSVQVTQINGNLLGIDYRPANRNLYGLTDTDGIYTINPNTGAAKFVCKLSTSFDGGFQSGVDFNPAADRLRVVGSNDQNYRINVDPTRKTCDVTVDGTLAYGTGSSSGSANPNITGAGYTNSFAGPPSPMPPAKPTRTTQLYGIDYDRDELVLQNPPNDGTLTTVGRLGVNFAPIVGFDIFATDTKGGNIAFALSGSNLYTISLKTGAAKRVGNVPDGGFVGFAISPAN